MLSALPHGAAGFFILCFALMPGCSTQTHSTAAGPKFAEDRREVHFSLDTPLEMIAADKNGKAILHRDIPGLMASPSYELVDDMSLSQIATVSGGQISMMKLNLIQADLAKLQASKKEVP